MAFVGSAPIGSLLAGGLAHWIGAPVTVMMTGTCVVAGAVWFAFELPNIRPIMQPIYQELGLLTKPVTN